MLLVMLEFKDAYVYRTRDKEMLELGTIVVDVGGVFDLDTYVSNPSDCAPCKKQKQYLPRFLFL